MRNSSLNHHSGFSMAEMLITIAVIGILSAIAVSSVGNINRVSKETVAQNIVETLNNATKEFGHAQWELFTTDNPIDADETIHLLRTLQWTDPDIELGVAGPFMRPNWNPVTSSSSDDYRAVWSGSYWKLATPGESGTGLKINFDAEDVGTNVDFGTDFTPFK